MCWYPSAGDCVTEKLRLKDPSGHCWVMCYTQFSITSRSGFQGKVAYLLLNLSSPVERQFPLVCLAPGKLVRKYGPIDSAWLRTETASLGDKGQRQGPGKESSRYMGSSGLTLGSSLRLVAQVWFQHNPGLYLSFCFQPFLSSLLCRGGLVELGCGRALGNSGKERPKTRGASPIWSIWGTERFHR